MLYVGLSYICVLVDLHTVTYFIFDDVSLFAVPRSKSRTYLPTMHKPKRNTYGNVNVKRKVFLEAMQEIEGSPDMEVWMTDYDVCLQILPCAVNFSCYHALLSPVRRLFGDERAGVNRCA